MKRFKVRKLRLSNEAETDLRRLRLTAGDYHIVLSLGQRLECAHLSLRALDAAQVSLNKRLRKLEGVILIIDTRTDEVVAVCKDLLEVIRRSNHHD